jgi:hypothetical protein
MRVKSASSNKLADNTEAGHVAMHKNETNDADRIINPFVIDPYVDDRSSDLMSSNSQVSSVLCASQKPPFSATLEEETDGTRERMRDRFDVLDRAMRAKNLFFLARSEQSASSGGYITILHHSVGLARCDTSLAVSGK